MIEVAAYILALVGGAVGGALIAGPWWYDNGYDRGCEDTWAEAYAEALRNIHPEDFQEEETTCSPPSS